MHQQPRAGSCITLNGIAHGTAELHEVRLPLYVTCVSKRAFLGFWYSCIKYGRLETALSTCSSEHLFDTNSGGVNGLFGGRSWQRPLTAGQFLIRAHVGQLGGEQKVQMRPWVLAHSHHVGRDMKHRNRSLCTGSPICFHTCFPQPRVRHAWRRLCIKVGLGIWLNCSIPI